MTDKELMQQALDALDSDNPDIQLRTAMALHNRLAQPESEPVAWYDSKSGWTEFHSFKPVRKSSAPDSEWLPLYTTPPQRKPLTDEEILAANKFMYKQHPAVYIQEDGEPENLIAFARAIEDKLRSKNT